MSDFTTLSQTPGRRPITIVEIDLDYCANTYGSAPCTASIPGTGSQKCFNCYATCQDKPNFSKTTKTYKFVEASSFLPIGENAFPCVESIDIAPTQLKVNGVSVASSVSVTLRDFPHHDRGIDPYVSTRPYTPNEQGTFFGKLKARNKYVANRLMRVNTGYIDEDRAVYTLTRTYLIDRIEGPDNDGKVTILGKDVLRLTDGDRATCPASTIMALTTPLTTSTTGLVTLSPPGVLAQQFLPYAYYNPGPGNYLGFVRIDNEIIAYRAVALNLAANQIEILFRAQHGTSAAAHSAGTKVQPCFFRYPATISYRMPFYEILEDILSLSANIDSSFLPVSDWTVELSTLTDSELSGDKTLFITEPTPVKDVLDSIAKSLGASIWYDEIDAEIKVLLLNAGDTATVTLTDDDILAGTMKVKELDKERFSRVVISHGMTSYLDDASSSNTKQKTIAVSVDAESSNAYDEATNFEFGTRWYQTASAAAEIAERMIDVVKFTPRQITFKLDAKDATLRTGDLFNVQSRLLQAPDGSKSAVKFIVTEFREVVVGSQYQYTAREMGS